MKISRNELRGFFKRQLAMDEELDPKGWRTNKQGQHYHIDGATGEIDAGMGGKFDGQKVGEGKGGKKSEYGYLTNNVPKGKEGALEYSLNLADKYQKRIDELEGRYKKASDREERREIDREIRGARAFKDRHVAEAVMTVHSDLREVKDGLNDEETEKFYGDIAQNPEFFSSIKDMSNSELRNHLLYFNNSDSWDKGSKAYEMVAIKHLEAELKKRGQQSRKPAGLHPTYKKMVESSWVKDMSKMTDQQLEDHVRSLERARDDDYDPFEEENLSKEERAHLDMLGDYSREVISKELEKAEAERSKRQSSAKTKTESPKQNLSTGSGSRKMKNTALNALYEELESGTPFKEIASRLDSELGKGSRTPSPAETMNALINVGKHYQKKNR